MVGDIKIDQGVRVRTVINLDDDACAEAMEALGVRTKTDAVNAALRDLVRRRRLQVLLKETADIPIIADPEEHYRAGR